MEAISVIIWKKITNHFFIHPLLINIMSASISGELERNFYKTFLASNYSPTNLKLIGRLWAKPCLPRGRKTLLILVRKLIEIYGIKEK